MDKNTKRGKQYIFVGGAPRSGTTMLQNILDSHPHIAGLPEFFMTAKILELRGHFHKYINKEMINEICTLESVDDNVASFIENIFDPLIKKYKCKLLSEKTPTTLLVFEGLIELFPDAKYIYIIRDPRAVVSSRFGVKNRMVTKEGKNPYGKNSIRLVISMIKKYLSAGYDVYKKYPEKILPVIYEKLIENPEFETKRICQFLEVKWSKQMMHPKDVKHLGEKAMTSERNVHWYSKEMYNRNPDKKSMNKWKNNLTSSQQIRVVNAFKNYEPLLEFCNYDFSLDHLSGVTKFFGHITSSTRSKAGDLKVWLGCKLIGE